MDDQTKQDASISQKSDSLGAPSLVLSSMFLCMTLNIILNGGNEVSFWVWLLIIIECVGIIYGLIIVLRLSGIALVVAFMAGHILSIITKVSQPGCGYQILIWVLAYVFVLIMVKVYIDRTISKIGLGRAIIIGITAASILGFVAGAIIAWPSAC